MYGGFCVVIINTYVLLKKKEYTKHKYVYTLPAHYSLPSYDHDTENKQQYILNK